MPDIFRFNAEMEQYLYTLPTKTQQQIRQSNAKIGCVEDLRQLLEQLRKEEEQ